MKKMLCLFLALIMCALLFAACGGEKEKEPEGDNENVKNEDNEMDDDEIQDDEADTETVIEKGGYVYGEIIDKVDSDILVLTPYSPGMITKWGETVHIVTEEADKWKIGDEIEVEFTKAERPYDKSKCVRIIADRTYRLALDAKPVIYLYPEEDTECSVKVSLAGKLTCTYPEHGENGWQNFVARPDGTLIFPDGKQYYALYWEGVTAAEWDFSKGFCVRGEDTAAFLEWALAEQGLSAREANEFIIYWLPIMQENPYNVISFQTKAYTDAANLEIYPCPDSLLRVFMAFYASDTEVEIAPQTFKGFERKGFTVVEWGGSIIE